MEKDELMKFFNLAWPNNGDSLSCAECGNGGRQKCALSCFTAREEIAILISRADDVERLVEAAKRADKMWHGEDVSDWLLFAQAMRHLAEYLRPFEEATDET